MWWTEFKQFRRLYPKIRISPSLLMLYKKNNNRDWTPIFDYLTGQEIIPTQAMIRGRELHEQMEVAGVPEQLRDFFGCEEWEYEKFITHEMNDFIFSGIIDAIGHTKDEYTIIDWKTGGMQGYGIQLQFYRTVWNLINVADVTRRVVLAHVDEGLTVDEMVVDFGGHDEDVYLLIENLLTDLMSDTIHDSFMRYHEYRLYGLDNLSE